jgi:hypothetical protein
MNGPVDDPLGIAISRALNVLAEALDSQDLPAVYALIGSQLADAGRQDAEKFHVTDIAEECARHEAGQETADYKAAEESAVTLTLARLHTEGLRADEKRVRVAVHAVISTIQTGRVQARLHAHLKAHPIEGPK